MKARKAAGWSRLDNAAKIFPPTSGKRDSKVFRFICELHDPVDPALLQQALELALESFPHFRSILRRGLFWYYLEGSPLPPLVQPETIPPCAPLYDPVQKNLLFRVAYYRRRITFEIYHALTDGTGALQFLRVLVYQYLLLAHGDSFDGVPPRLDYDASLGEKADDSFQKYYSEADGKKRPRPPRPFRLSGAKLRENALRVIEGEVSAAAVIELAHRHNATVTAYLTGVLLCAIYEEMSLREREKAIVVSVPVNLRKYFQSESARNFFGVIKVRYQFPSEGADLDTVIAGVAACFVEELTTQRLSARMNALSALEHNVLAKLIPLFIKDISLQIAGQISRRDETCSFSNLGRVEMPAGMDAFIRLFGVFNSAEALKLCMCSFGDRMVMTFTSPFIQTEVQKRFFRRLTGEGIPVVIRSNQPDFTEEN